MVPIDLLAKAVLNGDALELRSLALEWLHENPRIGDSAPPVSKEPDVLATAAAPA